MENYDLENSALHRKLQSKNDALKIMRAEVERFRTERDQFKLMAETVQMRYTAMKNSLENSEYNDTFGTSSSTLGFLLNQTREKNIALQTETETLKQKLYELQGDIKLLRNKNLEMTKLLKIKESKSKEQDIDELQKQWNEEKSKLIDQLENLKKKNAQQQFDFRSLLDEKEEIVTERDAFKCKAHRLNHELNVTLKGNDSIDIDSLILENKFLQERVINLESELQHLKKSSSKMQTLLEQKKVKGIIKLGDDRNNQMIMSHKQVKKLLNEGTVSELPLKASTITDLKALCLALLDNLNDKSTALSHQKKTNRLLAAKIATLEQKISKFSGNAKSDSLLSPAQFLLSGYTSSKVDEDLRLIKEEVLHKNGIFGESSESNKSLMSSEIETQSMSDISTELRHLSYIKILNDEEINDDIEEEIEDCESQLKLEEQSTELPDLPPEIQKLVDEAMNNSEK
ncbi:hypothetical protein PVAND_010503 [Polypedilum vanderplanki]|uniref:Coiled-coil domain-containing protein n=1 Tax=Polypedilum vanderplanki TaxID=319348 RepID=A0A9J6CGF6_POLVA|nr:hypothetical protein PVAND_010503 [Polypedilum vanderplanki]